MSAEECTEFTMAELTHINAAQADDADEAEQTEDSAGVMEEDFMSHSG